MQDQRITVLRFIVAFIIIAMVGFYVYEASFGDIPEANQRTVDTVVPFLLGVIAGVSTFYFGSSQVDDKQKDKD